MPSEKPKIVIRSDNELISKLDIVAKSENRSRGNMAETIIREFIANYEKKNGTIKTNNVNIDTNNGTINL